MSFESKQADAEFSELIARYRQQQSAIVARWPKKVQEQFKDWRRLQFVIRGITKAGKILKTKTEAREHGRLESIRSVPTVNELEP